MCKKEILYVTLNHKYRIAAIHKGIQSSNTCDTLKIILLLLHIYNNIFLAINQIIYVNAGVLQLNNINFFETLDIALFFCQFFCIFYSYFLVLCDIIVSGGVSYG